MGHDGRRKTHPPGAIVVTGGASGIGRAVAEELARSSEAAILLIDLDPAGEDVAEALGRLRGRGDVRFFQTDVSSRHEVEGTFARIAESTASLTGVVNNAGIMGREAALEETLPGDWNQVLGVNLLGAAWVTAASLPLLRRAPRGMAAIVNVASIVSLEGAPRHPIYAASKAALISLTMSLARELAHQGIRVNAVSPGSVAGTGLWQRSYGRAPSLSEYASLTANHPLRRLAAPKDVAGVISFLLSERAAHITGACIDVDGGERWRLP